MSTVSLADMLSTLSDYLTGATEKKDDSTKTKLTPLSTFFEDSFNCSFSTIKPLFYQKNLIVAPTHDEDLLLHTTQEKTEEAPILKAEQNDIDLTGKNKLSAVTAAEAKKYLKKYFTQLNMLSETEEQNTKLLEFYLNILKANNLAYFLKVLRYNLHKEHKHLQIEHILEQVKCSFTKKQILLGFGLALIVISLALSLFFIPALAPIYQFMLSTYGLAIFSIIFTSISAGFNWFHNNKYKHLNQEDLALSPEDLALSQKDAALNHKGSTKQFALFYHQVTVETRYRQNALALFKFAVQLTAYSLKFATYIPFTALIGGLMVLASVIDLLQAAVHVKEAHDRYTFRAEHCKNSNNLVHQDFARQELGYIHAKRALGIKIGVAIAIIAITAASSFIPPCLLLNISAIVLTGLVYLIKHFALKHNDKKTLLALKSNFRVSMDVSEIVKENHITPWKAPQTPIKSSIPLTRLVNFFSGRFKSSKQKKSQENTPLFCPA